MNHSVYPHGHMAETDSNGVAMFIPASPGMCMREYYAAHAPEVPDWFRYQAEGMPSEGKSAMPDRMLELNTEQRKELLDWESGVQPDFHKLTAATQAFMLRSQRIEAANKRFHDWHMKSREEKYWKWRWYFADKMIEGSMK